MIRRKKIFRVFKENLAVACGTQKLIPASLPTEFECQIDSDHGCLPRAFRKTKPTCCVCFIFQRSQGYHWLGILAATHVRTLSISVIKTTFFLKLALE